MIDTEEGRRLLAECSFVDNLTADYCFVECAGDDVCHCLDGDHSERDARLIAWLVNHAEKLLGAVEERDEWKARAETLERMVTHNYEVAQAAAARAERAEAEVARLKTLCGRGADVLGRHRKRIHELENERDALLRAAEDRAWQPTTEWDPDDDKQYLFADHRGGDVYIGRSHEEDPGDVIALLGMGDFPVASFTHFKPVGPLPTAPERGE